MESGLAESKVVALRLNSNTIRWQERENRVVKDKLPMAPGKKWVGLIQLSSAETGEPLAMFPDGVIQRMRVAVTSALAAKAMARQDAQERRREMQSRKIPEYGSDLIVDLMHNYGFKYAATNPGSSFRALHDSSAN